MLKKSFNFVAVILATVTIGLVACNNIGDMVNNTDTSVSKGPVSNNIRYFDSYEKLSREIYISFERATMPDLMRAPGQGSNDFVSFGELAEMAYEDVAQYQDEYKNIEEVRAAVAMYPDYLELVEDEDGEYYVEKKLSRSGVQYILNEDRMYQVGDTLIKFLDSVMLEAHFEHYETLQKVNNNNYYDFVVKPNSELGVTKFVGGCRCCNNPLCTGCCGGNWNFDYIGKEKENHDVKTINVNGINRDHKLTVIVRMHPVGGNRVIPLYIFEGRRKGLANLVWWAFGQDVKFDLTVTIGIIDIVSGSLVEEKYKTINKNGIAFLTDYCANCAKCTRSFLFPPTNTNQIYLEPYDIFVFVKTSGFARFNPDVGTILVPFNFEH